MDLATQGSLKQTTIIRSFIGKNQVAQVALQTDSVSKLRFLLHGRNPQTWVKFHPFMTIISKISFLGYAIYFLADAQCQQCSSLEE